ncbi:MAG: DUF1801 domain-containing protein [Pseudomonadota bacterium]
MDEVAAHIAKLEPERRRDEAQALDRIFREVSGFQPKLWSGKMIGYGQYPYTYKTGHSGVSLATGFAAPKRQITLYIMPGYEAFPDIMDRLGPHKFGKACVYITRLEKIDETALRALIRAGLDRLNTLWPVEPT